MTYLKVSFVFAFKRETKILGFIMNFSPIPVFSYRCQCEHCHTQNLDGATEYRCCREVVDALGKMAFDGSIENIKCITEHEDYGAMSNKTVLLQVAPLLRNKDGIKYKRRAGTSENELV
jgi:hypothetical protein